MKLRDLLTNLAYTCSGDLDTEVSDLVYDSRKAGLGKAFVCLSGTRADGHSYAEQAVQAGCCAVIAEHEVETHGAPLVLVENTRPALAEMSAALFGRPAEHMRVVGITGTKGKTTTAHMVRAILEEAGISTGMIGTVGIEIGKEHIHTVNTTPESYEIQRALRRMIDAGCTAAVLEASSIGLRDHRLDSLPFFAGVFTNFSEDHIGGEEHKDMEEYLACKSMLFTRCETGVVNLDDPAWEGVTRGHTCRLQTFGFSPEAELRAENEHLVTRPGFLGVGFSMKGRRNLEAEVDIPGHFNVYNALAAAAVCTLFDVPDEAIQRGLARVKVKGRVEPVPVPGNYTLLIDYAHNAVSMESILTTLREYHPHRLICLFGAGGNRPRARRYEMGEASGRLADLSVVTEDNSRFEDVMDIIADIRTGLDKTDGEYIVIPNRTDAIRWCIENAQEGDIVVLAGKGHEDYQEIRGERHHYDEREVIAAILADREKGEAACK